MHLPNTQSTVSKGPSGSRSPFPVDASDLAIEAERIRTVYAKRKLHNVDRVYSRSVPYHRLAVEERRQVMAELLRSLGITTMAQLNVLEVGCGNGAILRQMLDYGAEPACLYGVDLLLEALREAKPRSSSFHFVCGNAGQLPFPDSSFGIVVTFTLFTSVLDRKIREAIAAELLRVLCPGGRIIWYDFAYNNPKNPDVRGIPRKEIGSLFPGCRIHSRRITLAPPLGRLIARASPRLFRLVSRFKLLCTHYLCLVEKSESQGDKPNLPAVPQRQNGTVCALESVRSYLL